MTESCFGHLNDFAHLDVDLRGAEEGFDLGFKFEQRESDESSVHPETGIKAWAEPFLALYVSYVSLEPGPALRGTLHYGLGRSKWKDQSGSSSVDQDRLLVDAKPLLADDLRALVEGKIPQTTTTFRYL
jgi:hypothetical protein